MQLLSMKEDSYLSLKSRNVTNNKQCTRVCGEIKAFKVTPKGAFPCFK